MELAELRSWALAHPQMPQAVAVLRLIESHERLGEQVQTQLADAMEERDKARAELAKLKEAVWPGLPKWEPIPEEPQQDFYLAIVEVMRTASDTCDQYASVIQGGKRLPAPELSQDPAFAAFVLGALEKDRDKLRASFEHIGVGDFRQGWLDEADRIWADRHNDSPASTELTVWVARTRELVTAMVDAHHAAGLKTQYELEHPREAA